MTATEGPTVAPPLLDRLLGRGGLRRLSRLRAEWPPLLWYAATIVIFETVVLQAYNASVGRTVVFVSNPLWLVRPVLLLGAAWGTHALYRRYERALERSLLGKSDDRSQFETLAPDWLSLLVVGAGVTFTLVNAVVALTVPQIYAAGGPARVVRFLVVTPFGYVPVLGTFLATYLAVQVLLPRRLERQDIALDYLDPENLGGMRPVGELLKFSYYLLVVGLVGYAVATYGPYLLPGPFRYEGLSPPGTAVNALFTAVWVASVGVMLYGIYVVHRYMARQKKERIHQLNQQIRDEISIPWEISEFDMVDPPEEYQRYRAEVELVSETREYPATFTMWTQLIVGVLLPKAVQMLLSAA